MDYLFPNFLNDVQQYKESQVFWENLCLRVLSKHKASNLWTSEIETQTPNAAEQNLKIHEGNPIFRLVNVTQSKGVRIIQQDPIIHTKWEMAAWTNLSGDEHSETGVLNELVFTCSLSLKSANTFEQLFEKWILPETNTQTIKEAIKGLGIG